MRGACAVRVRSQKPESSAFNVRRVLNDEHESRRTEPGCSVGTRAGATYSMA